MIGRLNAITPRNSKPIIAVWGYLSRFLLTICPKRCSQVEHYPDFCCLWLVVVPVDKLMPPKSGLSVLFVVVVLLGNCGHDPDKGSRREVWKPGSLFPYFHNSSRHQRSRKLSCYFVEQKLLLTRFHWNDHYTTFSPHTQVITTLMHVFTLGVKGLHVRV